MASQVWSDGSHMKRTLTTIALALVVLAGVIALTGCGEQATAPVNTQYNGLSSLQWVDSSGSDPFAASNGGPTAAGVKVDFDASMVTPLLGGKVELELETGESELFIPPGAVRLPVVVTAAAVQVTTPYGSVALYDFGPDGLKFNRAAKLDLEVNAAEGAVLSLFWYNPASRRWEAQESCVVKNGKVKFSVYHFSKYGIA